MRSYPLQIDQLAHPDKKTNYNNNKLQSMLTRKLFQVPEEKEKVVLPRYQICPLPNCNCEHKVI